MYICMGRDDVQFRQLNYLTQWSILEIKPFPFKNSSSFNSCYCFTNILGQYTLADIGSLVALFSCQRECYSFVKKF